MRLMMRFQTIFALGAIAAALSAGGCSSSATPSGPQGFQQIERLARPAVKEAFEAFTRHDETNRSSPFADPILGNDINSFMTTVAGRDATTANFVQGVLIPDLMVADLSKTGVSAAYLGVETGGVTGSLFGGRGLHDDVIKTSLGVIFGGTVAALTSHDDGKESPCLADDNVPYGGKHDTATFPYLGAPR